MSKPRYLVKVRALCDMCEGHGYYVHEAQLQFLEKWRNKDVPQSEIREFEKAVGFSPLYKIHKHKCTFCIGGYQEKWVDAAKIIKDLTE